MKVQNIDQYTMMYKTDHHWTTRAGFYAYCKLEDYLTQIFQCDVDSRIGDINNYNIEVYEKWHLGSNGQRTGIYFAGIDDFELIVPKFETTIQREKTIGTMQELVYNRKPLQNKEYTSRYTYDYVLDAALGNYRNLDCKNDLKILIVTDSYGKAVNPFLIMGFSEVRFLYDRESQQLTKDYIDSYCPDIVILMYYPDFLAEGSLAFQFQGFGDEEQ